jgi:hypothetical protein
MLPTKDKYLPIIEHFFHCITHFSYQIISFIHTFVLYTNGLKVDEDYIPELDFFLLRFDSKYHNLYIKLPVLCCLFQNSLQWLL